MLLFDTEPYTHIWAYDAASAQSVVATVAARGDTAIMSKIINMALAMSPVNRARVLNRSDGDLSTPLHRACANGHTEIAAMLLAFPEVDPNAVNMAGEVPLQLAMQGDPEERVELVSKLLRHPKIDLFVSPYVYIGLSVGNLD
jgi:ankyrin repeat protein